MPLKLFLLVLFKDCAFAVIGSDWLSLDMALQVTRVSFTFHAQFHRACVHTCEAVTVTSVSEVCEDVCQLA